MVRAKVSEPIEAEVAVAQHVVKVEEVTGGNSGKIITTYKTNRGKTLLSGST